MGLEITTFFLSAIISFILSLTIHANPEGKVGVGAYIGFIIGAIIGMIGSILLYGNSFSMFIIVAIILCVVGGIGGIIGGVIGSIMRDSFEANKILGIIITVLLIAGVLYFFGSSIFPPNKYKEQDVISVSSSWTQEGNSDTPVMIVDFVDSYQKEYGLMPARINKNGDIVIRMSSMNGYPVYPDLKYLGFQNADKQFPYRLGVLNDFKQYEETFTGTLWIQKEHT